MTYANSQLVYIDRGTGITHLPNCPYQSPTAMKAKFAQAGVWVKTWCGACFRGDPWIRGR